MGDRLLNGSPYPIGPLSVLSACLSLHLSVCNVGVLWPNGWMDQDETCHGDPGHIVLDGTQLPQRGTASQFSAHVRCGQTAGWIMMPLT